jgi:hypothetical protein
VDAMTARHILIWRIALALLTTNTKGAKSTAALSAWGGALGATSRWSARKLSH